VKTRLIPATSREAIIQALEVLQRGGLVAFPTDTVYGVGALAFDGDAIKSIYTAKDRPVEKAIAVLLGGSDNLDKVTSKVPPIAAKLASHFWPGPLTLVVPKHPLLPEVVSEIPTVGVRVPDHPVAQALLRAAGPMAVSSANISGQDNPKSAEEVMRQLSGRIHLILDGGKTPGGVPSTVVDCTGVEPVILREGPVRLEEILESLI
jgi:L-threonylcarbamoyladenylate synthase